MTIQRSGFSIRKAVTRVLATSALLVMYGVGMIATTGAVMTAGSTAAYAQRGRGRGGGWDRGRGRGRGWGGGGAGAAIGLGIGAAVIGGAIAAQQAQQAQQNAINYCAQRYRSFDPNTMSYVGTGGVRRPCP
jgi:hypothetical protein